MGDKCQYPEHRDLEITTAGTGYQHLGHCDVNCSSQQECTEWVEAYLIDIDIKLNDTIQCDFITSFQLII